MPCEPVADLGLQVKAAARKAGYARPGIVALTNDWLAYALMPDQYRKGNYEAMMSFYGDQFGPALLTAGELAQVRAVLIRRLTVVQVAIDEHVEQQRAGTAGAKRPASRPGRRASTGRRAPHRG